MLLADPERTRASRMVKPLPHLLTRDAHGPHRLLDWSVPKLNRHEYGPQIDRATQHALTFRLKALVHPDPIDWPIVRLTLPGQRRHPISRPTRAAPYQQLHDLQAL